MPEDSSAKKAIQFILRGDRQYTTMLAVCWAVTTLLSLVLGGLFMLLGILAFLTRGGTDVVGVRGLPLARRRGPTAPGETPHAAMTSAGRGLLLVDQALARSW